MNKELHRDQNNVTRGALAIFLLIAVVIAWVVATGRNNFPMASNDLPATGASGIARPHPPLDRAPGEPLKQP